MRVLVARASEAETGLPFAGLIDLLDEVASEELAVGPGAAAARAGGRALPGRPDGPAARGPGDLARRALGLRALSRERPLLVAVDDVQWLDRASEDALAYAARRLQPSR